MATTEERCRAIVDLELAADWRPPERPWPKIDSTAVQFHLPEILLKYRHSPDPKGGQDGYTVLVTHRFSIFFATPEHLLSGQEKLGQMLAELTGLLRAHSVAEHCGLASSEALGWRGAREIEPH